MNNNFRHCQPCVHHTIFLVVKLDLYIQVLLLDRILALKKLRVRLTCILFTLCKDVCYRYIMIIIYVHLMSIFLDISRYCRYKTRYSDVFISKMICENNANHNSASGMFVNLNTPSFGELLRKYVY